MKKGKKTTDALKIINKNYYDGKPERLASLEQERVNAKIARDLYALRLKNKMTQKQLAILVGTSPSVISRIENSDYSGHSLSMLQRVAHALKSRIEVKFIHEGFGSKKAVAYTK